MIYNIFLLFCLVSVIGSMIRNPSELKRLHHTATVIIIIINIIMFIITFGGNLFLNVLGNSFYYTISKLQLYRLITSMFYHAGFMHILCNTISLINIGLSVELIMGKKKMLIAYFTTGIIGGLISIIIHTLIGNPVISVGASGAICGLVGVIVSSLTGDKMSKLQTTFIAILPLILIGFSGGGVDNICHFVCFFVGIPVGKILRKMR